MKFYLIFVAVAFLTYCNACESDDDCPSDKECDRGDCVARCSEEASANCYAQRGPYAKCVMIWGTPQCLCPYLDNDDGQCCETEEDEDEC